MQSILRITLKALALLGLLSPAPVAAQGLEVCGNDDTFVMTCTFDNGAKQVGLCLNRDRLTYQFGPDFSDLELQLTSPFADLDYVPDPLRGGRTTETVTFHNVDTRYTVFTTLSVRDAGATAEGGIIVTGPNGTRQELSCDPGSVWPNDPLSGIGQLAAFVPGNDHMVLSACLEQTDDTTSCLGNVQTTELRQNRCTLGPDLTDCWATEADAWDVIMQTAMITGLAEVTALRGDQYAQRLQASQESWAQTRALDCDLILMLPFAADGGAAKCHAHYAAERLQVLRGIVQMAEFDG